MGNIEPTSLVFWVSVLPLHHIGSLMSPLYLRIHVYAAHCLRGPELHEVHVYGSKVMHLWVKHDMLMGTKPREYGIKYVNLWVTSHMHTGCSQR